MPNTENEGLQIMIEIKKTTDQSVYNEFGFGADCAVMAAKDKDEIFGAGSVSIKDGYAVLEAICVKEEYKMFNMEFAIGKALLNMLDLAGVRYVLSDMTDERLMTALRFKKEYELPGGFDTDKNYNRFLCLDGYFAVHVCE